MVLLKLVWAASARRDCDEALDGNFAVVSDSFRRH
jgi:hypothetical protein